MGILLHKFCVLLLWSTVADPRPWTLDPGPTYLVQENVSNEDTHHDLLPHFAAGEEHLASPAHQIVR